MSRKVDIIVITSETDQSKLEELSFWMGTAEAAETGRDDVSDTAPSSALVGNLLPLNGPLGEELWGGHKRVTGCVWAASTANLHWDRFLQQVRTAGWANPERVQLLMKDDGDSYFRMFIEGDLQNVVPAPAGGGFDRDWADSE